MKQRDASAIRHVDPRASIVLNAVAIDLRAPAPIHLHPGILVAVDMVLRAIAAPIAVHMDAHAIVLVDAIAPDCRIGIDYYSYTISIVVVN